MSSFFESFWAQVVGGLLVAAIVAVFSWLNWSRLRHWIAARDLPPADGRHFTVLVADLANDPDGRQTRHVLHSLERQFQAHGESRAFAVRAYPKCLTKGIAGDVAKIEAAAQAKGQTWLREQSAELLVWGEVAEENKVLRLRFLPREEGGSTPKGYLLNDVLELQADFADDLAEALVAIALTAASPAFAATHPLMRLLQPLLPKLEALVASSPRPFSPKMFGSLCNSTATAMARFGEQSGQTDWLVKAAKAFRAALDVHSRQDMPADWAMTQNNLGTALQTLGERSEGAAATQALGDAVKVFRAALEVRTRQDMPAQWAGTQNNLGNALKSLGARSEGAAATQALSDAVKAYRAALEVRTRRDMPAAWAMTMENLGLAMVTLASKSEGKGQRDALREAKAALADALTVYNQPGMDYYRAKCQRALDHVTAVLAAHEGGPGGD